ERAQRGAPRVELVEVVGGLDLEALLHAAALAHDHARDHHGAAAAVRAVDALRRAHVGLGLRLGVERVLHRLNARVTLQVGLEGEGHVALLGHGAGEPLVEQVVPSQRPAGGQRHARGLLQGRVLDGLGERPGQRALGEVLGRGVADAALGHHPQAQPAARRHGRLARLAVLSVDLQLALDAADDLEVDPAAPRLVEQPALGLLEGHASPPTTISLTRMWGWPTSVGTDPDFEPHMPGSLAWSFDTATTFLIVSGPLPRSIAPRTGSAIWPFRIM